MDVELKPCPFCGHIPEIVSYSESTAIRCDNEQCIIWTRQPVPYNDHGHRESAITAWNTRNGAGDAEDAARLRHLLDRHLSLTPVEGGGWDIAEYSEHGIETVLFGHTDARSAIDRVMQYHGQTDDAARAGERG